MRELCEIAFAHVGLDWSEHVVVDDKFLRPAEVDLLVGDATKAKTELGWETDGLLRRPRGHDGGRRHESFSVSRTAEPEATSPSVGVTMSAALAAHATISADPLGVLVAFGAGMLSFLSPCVLPLVPGYVSMVSGLSAAEIEAGRPA